VGAVGDFHFCDDEFAQVRQGFIERWGAAADFGVYPCSQTDGVCGEHGFIIVKASRVG